MRNLTRDPGVVDNVFYGKENHGILTVWLGIDFGGSYQSFGGLALSEEVAPDYVSELCKTFEVERIEDIKGKKCVALRCFDEWNSIIEGLETESGARFINFQWRKKHFPETKSPLEERREHLQRRIALGQRQISEELKELSNLDASYHELI
jgi:hypothetical protein